MSCQRYQNAYNRMTQEQKEIMCDLYYKGINRDGHTWNTYNDIEYTVARILEEEWKRKKGRQ